jgi:hypothetical protein
MKHPQLLAGGGTEFLAKTLAQVLEGAKGLGGITAGGKHLHEPHRG